MVTVKTFLQFVGVIFSVVGLVHVIRLMTGFDVVLGSWSVPMWISILGVIIAWFLAYNAFMLSKKKTKK